MHDTDFTGYSRGLWHSMAVAHVTRLPSWRTQRCVITECVHTALHLSDSSPAINTLLVYAYSATESPRKVNILTCLRRLSTSTHTISLLSSRACNLIVGARVHSWFYRQFESLFLFLFFFPHRSHSPRTIHLANTICFVRTFKLNFKK